MTIDERYELQLTIQSDIREHLPFLRKLASECRRVTEFGVRQGASTTALLSGVANNSDGRLTSYDKVCDQQAVEMLRELGGARFQFVLGGTLQIDIEPTELLFIDTFHTAQQLRGELARHAQKVRRWIALHDTSTFGETGEDGSPGLMVALREFLDAHAEWNPIYHVTFNNGLTVIERRSTTTGSFPWPDAA